MFFEEIPINFSQCCSASAERYACQTTILNNFETKLAGKEKNVWIEISNNGKAKKEIAKELGIRAVELSQSLKKIKRKFKEHIEQECFI